MLPEDDNQSLGDAATFAGAAKRRSTSEISLGDQQTLGGDGRSGENSVIDGLEVVDLEARYKVEGTLGQGGMGAVLLAIDTRLDRKVAIKRILGEAAGNRMAVQRFLTEAKAIAALNHPNIVQIYDYGRAKDGPFLIMEYVDGGSLLDRCRESALPLEEAIDLACQLCDGLAKAHDLKIIHRDIKPANVLLTKDGVPKLTDFGLAKAEAGDHGQTMTGAVLGTPDFMPPEQRRDASLVDHRSDLWSLAATVYQMATGRSPKIIRFDLLPAELTKVLGKALEDAKDARYQSARELRDALKTGLRTAAAAEELIEGACPACGVKNESSRRFCRGCAESLEAPCLKCDKAMPVWEEICGACGAKQTPLVGEQRHAMAAKQAEAEGLLGDFKFERAMEIAAHLRDKAHPKLKHLSNWAISFLVSIEQSRKQMTQVTKDALARAGEYENAHDYMSAQLTLEAVPEPLRRDVLARSGDSVASMLKRIETKLAEVQKEELARRRRAARDGAIASAKSCLDTHDYEGAVAALSCIPFGELTTEVITLRKEAEAEAHRRAAVLRIASGINACTQRLVLQLEELVRRKEHSVVRRHRFDRLARVVASAKETGVLTPYAAALIVCHGEDFLEIEPHHEKVLKVIAQAQPKAYQPFRNSIGYELRLIPRGEFVMGDEVRANVWAFSAGYPKHTRLTRPFFLGTTTVTHHQWKQVMGSARNDSSGNDYPVTDCSWDDAVEFCRRLTDSSEEKLAGRVYRLPTEAEWEYACRAGTTTRYSFSDDSSSLSDYAWFDKNSGGQAHSVGQKKPNGWGLFDMHGNVLEWCSDWYAKYPFKYPYCSDIDPTGPTTGSKRVVRGGSVRTSENGCFSTSRDSYAPGERDGNIGFRLVVSVPVDSPMPP